MVATSKSKAFPELLAQAARHFSSGMNDPGEVRGFALSGRNFGITATRASLSLREALIEFAGPGCLQELFVDSGAFSEVDFNEELLRFEVVKEITHDEWLKRLELYRWAAAAFGRRCTLVAPDRVGCQETTLARIERYAAYIQLCASARANIIVPVQKGALPMSEFFRRASKLLGLRNLIAGIPMQKDATSLAELEELVSSLPRSRPTDDRQGARIHLLGIGPRSKRYAPAIALIKRLRPHAMITSDSATVPGISGRTNGPGGTPRALTIAQDKARAMGLAGPAVKTFGLIEQGWAEIEKEREAAEDAGWFDEELYDSVEEARAHRLAGYPDAMPSPEQPAPQPPADVRAAGDDTEMPKAKAKRKSAARKTCGFCSAILTDGECFECARGAGVQQAARDPMPRQPLLVRQMELSLQQKAEEKRPPAIRAYFAEGEIVVDNFAGGGGASSGIERALGRSPEIAINHDEEAIAMHKANHPTTQHFLESVWKINPRIACNGKPVALAWFSPTCTHFSKAKGTALDADSIKIRGLAWVATRWAAAVRPRIICLENVEEFQKWGPLHKQHSGECCDESAAENRVLFDEEKARAKKARRKMKKLGFRPNGCLLDCLKYKPIKSREGETFRAFVLRLRKLGYVVEWRELRACDYGAPTTRKRLFMVARCDGMPIVWPLPSHGPGRANPYRTAAECIDWSLECPSIFERGEPLRDKTLARIARGIKKFVLDNPRPFIVPAAYGDKGGTDVRVNSIDEPLRTVCGKRGGHALITPMVMKVKSYGGGGNDAMSAEEPLRTVLASKRGEFAIAVPYLIHQGNGERNEAENKNGSKSRAQEPRIYDPLKPLGTIMAQRINHAACVAMLIKHNGGNNDRSGSSGQHLDRPMDAIATHNTKAVTLAHLVRYNGDRREGEARGATVADPFPTQDTSNRFGLVASHLIKLRGTSESHIDSSASSVEEPVPTLSASGTHMAQVAAFLVRYNGESGPQAVDGPIGTLDTNDRYSLITVTIDGEEYIIADIGMRMLTPRELFRAQGFKDHEISFGGQGWVDQLLQPQSATAKPAGKASSRKSKLERSKLVALDARISLGLNVLELRSRESSPSSASSALLPSSYPLPNAIRDSARSLVDMLFSSDRTPPTTKEASATNSLSSTSPSPGACSVEISGDATRLHVSDATRSIAIDRTPRSGRFTTSLDGPSSQLFDSTLATLFSFAADAIASFIRERTSEATSFDLRLTVSDQYEIEPMIDGKKLSKTAQIRMCGNSVPPVMSEAIGRAQLEVAPQLEAA